MDYTDIDQMQKKAEEARFNRQKQRKVFGNQKYIDEQDRNINERDFDEEDDYYEDEKIKQDEKFRNRQKFNKKFEKNEEELKVHKLKNQVGYFGYELEPLNMKAEREKGRITEDGYYQQNKANAADIDPWLQQIDSQQKDDMKNMLKKRKTQGVFSDNEDSSDEEEKVQKKVKQENKPQNERKEMFLNAPLFMLQQKLSLLLDENTTVNQQLKKLQEKIKPQQIANKPTFKKNIRKKDRELLEKQAQEALKNQPTDEEKEAAQGQFDMIVEMADAILQKSGDGGIYTQTKEQIEHNLKLEMEKKELSSSEESGSDSDNDKQSNSSSSEDEDNENNEKKKDYNSSDDDHVENEQKEIEKKEQKILQKQEKELEKEKQKQQKLEEKQLQKEGKKVNFAVPSKKPKQDIDLNEKSQNFNNEENDDDDDIFNC